MHVMKELFGAVIWSYMHVTGRHVWDDPGILFIFVDKHELDISSSSIV